MSQAEKFEYSVLKTSSVVVVSLSGEVVYTALEALERCRQEVLAFQDARFVVFDFGRVRNLTMDAVPAFTEFQKNLRAKGMELRLCAITEGLKTKLVNLGIVRQAEITASLKEGLSYVSAQARAAMRDKKAA